MERIRNIFLISGFVLLSASCNPPMVMSPPLLPPSSTPGPVACTQEAKQCPDGSYVGRTGPDCAFAACPAAAADSGVQGQVLLGPTCPVERIPPDPACAPKPYQATIDVKTSDGSKLIKTFTSDANGNFKVSLDAGSYLLVPHNQNPYPAGRPESVTVNAHEYVQVTINFDTSIR